jgi:thiamine pyrophosphokinase
METVILANGRFPYHKIPLGILKNAKQIVCCDGAAKNLIEFGLEPSIIIGDLDSLDIDIKEKHTDILIKIDDQETNDLTKAVNWCIANSINKVTILGATGKREDHAIGNISLLAEYTNKIKVKMISDYGEFIPITRTTVFESFEGQQVSLFSLNPETIINSENLKYPLSGYKLDAWWKGTLNESTAKQFTVRFDSGKIIVYKLFGG